MNMYMVPSNLHSFPVSNAESSWMQPSDPEVVRSGSAENRQTQTLKSAKLGHQGAVNFEPELLKCVIYRDSRGRGTLLSSGDVESNPGPASPERYRS